MHAIHKMGGRMTTAPATTVTHLSGVRFAIKIRTHEIVVDQTLAGGGADTAPSPLELLGASLGSCVAYYVHQFLHVRGLPADGLKVNVSQTRGVDPTRIDSFSVEVILPAGIPDRYMSLLERVIDACPAHNTLSRGARIGVTFTPETEALVSV